VMREKGFLDAEIAHDTRPTYGDRRQLTIKFTVSEGPRSHRRVPTGVPSPAQRCSR
jgi:hypothetical protein